MRYLVLTDIHANLEALDACLADARVRGYDATLVLGDVVGYGADPNAVIDRVTALNPVAMVRGNHDKVACGLEQALVDPIQGREKRQDHVRYIAVDETEDD